MASRILILLFSILLFVQTSYGQSLIRPDFLATYDFRCVKDTVAGEYFKENKFVLVVNKKLSRFHHLNAQFNDSIVTAFTAANPRAPSNGEIQSLDKFNSYYQKNKKSYAMDFWVEKDVRKNIATASILWRIPSFHLEISYPLPWELNSAVVDTINGIVCRSATLDYGGRKWTAYYSTDIAIPQGPYVFSGLPGLIVRIEDERSWYRFDLAGYMVKPKGKHYWGGRYYNYGSQKLDRDAYVDRVAKETKNPSTGPVPTTESQLLEMKQRFSKYNWYLLEQR